MSDPTETPKGTPGTPESIKAAVRTGYAEALARTSSGGGCCGSASGEAAASLAERLGYDAETLATLPAGAVASAFGCGNPFVFADVREGETVVDIGSGAGIDCFVAARAVGPTGHVIGIDMTPAMIEAASANAREAGLDNVEFRLGDAESMPVDDASVDWVFSNCVINLAPDKPRVFAEVARILRPGGRVAISDIVLSDDLPPRVVESVDALIGCIAGAIGEQDYLAAMREAGLTDVEVRERLPYTLSATFEASDSGCGCGCGDAPAATDTARPASIEEISRLIEGKVWSARISARRR
jgi:SAM-dependent methyltransferase